MKQLHITTHSKNDKMAGFKSISTSVLSNPICAARAKCDGTICSKCYAMRYEKRFPALAQHLRNNYEILNDNLLSVEQIPFINDLYFRFESFGDIASVTQARNYFLIAKHNPKTTFALWTKNPAFIDKAIDLDGKPQNLKIILSSSKINVIEDFSRFDFVDHVFTVFTGDFVESHKIKINCKKQCIKCLKCYHNDTDFFITELLK